MTDDKGGDANIFPEGGLVLHKGFQPSEPNGLDFQLGEVIGSIEAELGAELKPPKGTFGHAGTYPGHTPSASPYTHWQGNGNMPVLSNEVETVPSTWAGRRGMGNCVIASWLNELKTLLTDAGVTAHEALRKIGAARKALEYYGRITGANPQTGAGDNGTEIRARIAYGQKVGYTDADGNVHKNGIYARFDPSDLKTLLFAMYNFDAVALSCEVTNENEDAFTASWRTGEPRCVWDQSGEASGQDNHCVAAVGRPNSSHITIISWDRPIDLTDAFRENQCHEAWCYSSPDRISKVTGKTYRGAEPALLEEYVRKLQHGEA